MYDQDRVIVVSENCGNVIFTKEFETYKDFVGLDVYLCKKQDPDTKGRVENVVKFVKTSFFDHKVFCGIDNLNSDLLDWLDRTGNGKINMTTRRTPRDMFKEEKESLIKYTPYSLRKKNDYITTATDLNYFIFRSNYYTLPAFRFKQGDKVLIEIVGDCINVYDAETKEFVARHKLLIGKGLTSKLANKEDDNKHSRLIKRTVESLGNNKLAIEFLNEIIREKPRYIKEQCGKLQFLYECLHKELILREQKSRATKIGKAHLPSFKTLEEYDLNFQPQLSKWQIEELKKLNWLKEKYNIIFMGSSGTGKTHLAVALGHLALSHNYKVFFSTLENLIYLLKTKEVFKSSSARVKYLYECHLVIIDEIGYQKLEKQDVLLMYELVNKLYNRTSIVITTSLDFAKWGELFQDESMVSAMLDRLTHNCQTEKVAKSKIRKSRKIKTKKYQDINLHRSHIVM